MIALQYAAAFIVCRENDLDAFVPEHWAMEGLEILEENMVMARLVHRDFEDQIKEFGDVVNTRRPGEFNTRRKTDSDQIELQDAVATNVQVPLDQHFYVSFTIKDGEQSKSFQDLAGIYLLPAMRQIGRSVDRALCGRVHALLDTPSRRVGRLSGMTSANAKDFVLSARERLNINKAYADGRNLVLSPASETSILATELFLAADKRGDGGEAVEEARLGRILGFQTFMDQNVNSITTENADTATGTVTNAADAGASGSQTVSIVGHEVVAGEYAVVSGNDQPTYATASTVATGDTTAVTLNEANKFATDAGATITVYKACAVNGAYAVGYTKGVVLDGFAVDKAPQQGQLIAFGTGASRRVYTVIDAYDSGSTRVVWLDRPLEVALADNDAAFPGPAGSFNLAFHRDSIALVTRPLALPNPRSGVMAGNANAYDVSMRVTMQYSIKDQGTIVTCDMLGGIALLDQNLAVPLLG